MSTVGPNLQATQFGIFPQELPKLDEKTQRNLHILISAQADKNSKAPTRFLERNRVSKVPARFDVDDQGNLQRVGAVKNFFLHVANFFTNGEKIDTMNDRVREVITQTLQAVDTHVDNLTKYADGVSQDLQTPNKNSLRDSILASLRIYPRKDFKNVPEDISLLDLEKSVNNSVLNNNEYFNSFTRHSAQHNPLPENYENMQNALITKIVDLKEKAGLEVKESDKTIAELYKATHRFLQR